MRRRAIGFVVAVACGIAACGGDTAPAAPAPGSAAAVASATTHATTSPTVTPSPSPSPGTTTTTFESAVYPYTLTTERTVLQLPWHAAENAWDGVQPVEMIGPFTDSSAVRDGGIFLIGAPSPDGLDAFFGRAEEHGVPVKGCTEARGRRDVTIGGVQGIAFVQECTATSAYVRVALVNGGFGIGAWVSVVPLDESAALERLVQLLDGLEWTTR